MWLKPPVLIVLPVTPTPITEAPTAQDVIRVFSSLRLDSLNAKSVSLAGPSNMWLKPPVLIVLPVTPTPITEAPTAQDVIRVFSSLRLDKPNAKSVSLAGPRKMWLKPPVLIVLPVTPTPITEAPTAQDVNLGLSSLRLDKPNAKSVVQPRCRLIMLLVL
jgi:hypothetical protein